jgi:outer membrane biosynthesis protein TonB
MKKLITIVALVVGLANGAFATGVEPGSNPNLESETVKNLEYPTEAFEQNIEGSVKVYFEVEEGQVVYTSIGSNAEQELATSAMDMVKSFSKEELERLCPTGNGKFVLPIKFEII